MPKSIQLLVVEDDVYARDAMVLLLCQDWRTRVIAEAGNFDEATRAAASVRKRLHAALVDLEAADGTDWPLRFVEQLRGPTENAPPRILCSAKYAHPDLLARAVAAGVNGFVLKDECGWAIAQAVAYSHQGQFPLTPGVRAAMRAHGLSARWPEVLVDGSDLGAELSPRERQVARRFLLYGPSLRNLSDELQIRADEVGKVVQRIYEKLGVYKLVEQGNPEAYFTDESVLDHMRRIIQHTDRRRTQAEARRAQNPAAKPRRVRPEQQDSLAFHLLTLLRRPRRK